MRKRGQICAQRNMPVGFSNRRVVKVNPEFIASMLKLAVSDAVIGKRTVMCSLKFQLESVSPATALVSGPETNGTVLLFR